MQGLPASTWPTVETAVGVCCQFPGGGDGVTQSDGLEGVGV